MGDVVGILPSAMYRMADHPSYTGTWYWCRHHVRAEPAQQSVNEVCPGSPCQEQIWQGTHTHVVCVRVGPFMSEREANRLADDELAAPLTMEVEQ